MYLIPVKMLLVSVRNLCTKQGTEYLMEDVQYLMVDPPPVLALRNSVQNVTCCKGMYRIHH